jgi:hypothetical protein
MVDNKKAKLLVIPFSVFLILCLASIFLFNSSSTEFPDAVELKRVTEPDFVASWFLRALVEDNIHYAKELIVPEAGERIDQWKTVSQHEAFYCEYDWSSVFNNPFEIQRISSGGSSYVQMDDTTVKARSSYGCSGSHHAMSIKDVIVKKGNDGWTIVDWGVICETPALDAEELCYP